MRNFVWLPLALLIGCAANNGPELLAGFDPPPPGPGQIQIIGPIVEDVKPGPDDSKPRQDVTLCSYLPDSQALDQTYDITAASGKQSAVGSHHAVLYMATKERPVDTHVCNDDDMTNAAYLAGAGGGDAGGVVEY